MTLVTRAGTWREARKGLPVLGTDGQVWLLDKLRHDSETPGHGTVVLVRPSVVGCLTREVATAFDADIDIVTNPEEDEGPGAELVFPTLSNWHHLHSHLFLIHGVHYDDVTGDGRDWHVLAGAHDKLHFLNAYGPTHLHGNPTS